MCQTSCMKYCTDNVWLWMMVFFSRGDLLLRFEAVLQSLAGLVYFLFTDAPRMQHSGVPTASLACLPALSPQQILNSNFSSPQPGEMPKVLLTFSPFQSLLWNYQMPHGKWCYSGLPFFPGSQSSKFLLLLKLSDLSSGGLF